MAVTLGIFAVIAGYLIGSFPTAYIVTKIKKGVDIRDIDVGNMGAAAVRRQLGLVPGMIVAALDIAKGAVVILLSQFLTGDNFIWVYAAGFAALLGHCFPVYIGFRGGQGTATVIGIFIVLAPTATLIMLAILAILLSVFRRIFPMTVASSPALPIVLWLSTGTLQLTIFSLVILVFMISRNIKGISNEISKLKHKLRNIRLQSKND